MTTSRKVSKERTRNRLIQGTLKVLYKDGPSALTTGRIAESAGVAQPTFYVHFSDMSDALQQAADLVSEKLMSRLQDVRDRYQRDPSGDALRDAITAAVNTILTDQKTAEVYLRHRRDVGSPLGRTFRVTADAMRQALLEDLRALGMADTVPDLDVHAELVVGVVFSIVEGILDRRIKDKAGAIETAAVTIRAGLAANARRAAEAAE